LRAQQRCTEETEDDDRRAHNGTDMLQTSAAWA
jgi:hypothetical protein